jgi:hypothetical protein
MKKCPTSLAIKEMKIKMTLRFHLSPVRMVILNKMNTSKYCKFAGGKVLL